MYQPGLMKTLRFLKKVKKPLKTLSLSNGNIFIAATCIVNELPIVTLNKKHFERIKGLDIAK